MTAPIAEASDAAEVARRLAEIWEPCENDSNFDDARIELEVRIAAEVQRERLVAEISDALDVVPATPTEARLLQVARRLAELPAQAPCGVCGNPAARHEVGHCPEKIDGDINRYVPVPADVEMHLRATGRLA